MTESSGENKNDSHSYRSILKGTSIFGGVQIFLILINLIRGKFVAMFLGPEGMGISSLFTSSSATITKISSLGLNLAIVKEVARNSEGDNSLAKILAAISLLIRFTALIGALICICFAGYLSELSFSTREYSWQFMLLGVSVFFTIAGNAKLSILQGLHEVKKMARTSIAGALTGLFAGVPLYYFYGDKGIVPAMVILSLTTYLFYSFGIKSISTHERFGFKEKFPVIKKLISLGLILMAGDAIGSLVTYIINIFIRQFGNLDSLGLFQAANSITNQYSGIVFSALALDYLPRLSKAANDNTGMRDIVNKQSETLSLIFAPIVIAIITCAPIIIKLLLTNDFIQITPLIRLMAIGIVLKGLQFPMGYITFAKDNKRVYFLLEGIAGNLLYLICNIICFYYFGLIGLGYGMILDSCICFLMYYIVNNHLYNYTFNWNVCKRYFLCIFLTCTCFAASFIESTVASYCVMILIFILSCSYSFLSLKKMITAE